MSDYIKEIETVFLINLERALKDWPDLIEFNKDNDNNQIQEGFYMALTWCACMPSLDKLYFNGSDFVRSLDDGWFCSEKVSHYIPNRLEDSLK